MESAAPDTDETPKPDPMAKARAAKAAKRASKLGPPGRDVLGPPPPPDMPTYVPPDPQKGLVPGMTVGEGFSTDKVEWTEKYYLDNYPRIPVIASKTQDIRVNGVAFRILKGVKCFLPEPHYAAYIDALNAERDFEEKWKGPEVKPTTPGSMVAIAREGHMVGFRQGDGPLPPRE